MAETAGGASASFSALRNIAATLLATCRTRLELLANEIEVGKLRAVELMLMGIAMAFCFGVGILLAVALLVALFWEQRLAVLAVCALAFLVFGGFLLARVRQMSSGPNRIFSASVAELEEDLRQLKAATGHEPPAR
ncbi:MAG: phage holin family protein [Candidatus Accumulibacter sp.]|jgi:uncharacterized membrane protein YqjE|nr:phage holin family protein [Accumulibacter sp.]